MAFRYWIHQPVQKAECKTFLENPAGGKSLNLHEWMESDVRRTRLTSGQAGKGPRT